VPPLRVGSSTRCRDTATEARRRSVRLAASSVRVMPLWTRTRFMRGPTSARTVVMGWPAPEGSVYTQIGTDQSAPTASWSYALLAQLVEHFHGKEGVAGSSPAEGSHETAANRRFCASWTQTWSRDRGTPLEHPRPFRNTPGLPRALTAPAGDPHARRARAVPRPCRGLRTRSICSSALTRCDGSKSLAELGARRTHDAARARGRGRGDVLRRSAGAARLPAPGG
jgi:hypothetical protein